MKTKYEHDMEMLNTFGAGAPPKKCLGAAEMKNVLEAVNEVLENVTEVGTSESRMLRLLTRYPERRAFAESEITIIVRIDICGGDKEEGIKEWEGRVTIQRDRSHHSSSPFFFSVEVECEDSIHEFNLTRRKKEWVVEN